LTMPERILFKDKFDLDSLPLDNTQAVWYYHIWFMER